MSALLKVVKTFLAERRYGDGEQIRRREVEG
jgi:hypothetical protein